MNNSSDDFVSWGTKIGIPETILRDLVQFAATEEEMRASIEAMLPGPPIHQISDIREVHEKDLMGIEPAKAGFLIVGGCPNGDPIAVDIRDDLGAVWYLSHEQMHGRDLRSVGVKVANSVPTFFEGLAEDESFPLDYWDAA